MSEAIIGLPKAEQEINEHIFERNFVKIHFYEDIKKTFCTFVCGRKGTGKTAILKTLKEDKRKDGTPHYDYCIEIVDYDFYKTIAMNYSNEILNPFADYTSEVREKFDVSSYFRLLWQFIISVEIMKVIIDKTPNLVDENVKQYIRLRHYDKKDIFDVAEDLLKMSLSVYGEENMEFRPLRALSVVKEKLKDPDFKAAKNSIKKLLGSKKKCLVTIDTLEDYFIREEVCLKAINGMIEGIKFIRQDYDYDRLHIKCCLPGEMYARLSFPNPAEMHSATTFLLWQVPDLIRVIAKRYYNVLNETHGYTLQDNIDWEKAKKGQILNKFLFKHFPREIENRQRFKESSLGYINRHTFKKPREYIEIIQRTLDSARKNQGIMKITEVDISKGIHQSINDILVEDNVTAYGRVHGIDVTEFAKTVFATQPRIMPLSRLRKIIRGKKQLIQDENLLEDDMLRILLEIGFLGVITKKTAETPPYYAEALFEYLIKGSLPISSDLQYALHPAIFDYVHFAPEASERICIYPKQWGVFDEEIESIPMLRIINRGRKG